MRRKIWACLWLLFAAYVLAEMPAPAWATTCGAPPFTLVNGQTADANQVMSNFTALVTCANSVLTSATIASPTITGTVAGSATYSNITLSNTTTLQGSGAISSTGQLSAPFFATATGQITNVVTATPTTFYTMAGATAGLWIVWANVNGAGAAGTYFAYAVIVRDPTGPSTARISGANGSLMTISVSGNTIQCTQSSGANQNVDWAVERIGA